MNTHGLSQSQSAGDWPASLPAEVPALRIDLRTRRIVEVNPALGELTGRAAAAWLGCRCDELWASPERKAIDRRLGDAVLVGRDRFGYLALSPGDTARCWVEADVRHDPRDGHRLLLALYPQAAPRPQQVGLAGASTDGTPDGYRAPESVWPDVPVLGDVPPESRAPMSEVDDAVCLVMTAMAAAGVAALSIQADGTVSGATPAAERLFGLPITRLRGDPMAQLLEFPGQAGPAFDAARVGKMRQSVAAVLAADGRDVALEWVPGTLSGAGFAVLDVGREESREEERLRHQAGLVSLVAHDVRNGLAAVCCQLYTLAEAIGPAGAHRSIVDKALHDAQRANRIVEDVLELSRPTRLHCVELDLAGVVRESLNRFRARAAARGTEIHEDLTEVRIMADLSRLERAFDNLVENALQAMPHFGTLTIGMRIEDRAVPGVTVRIADTGVGIQPDLRPNVFEPFVTDKPGGTGLGLAITHKMILAHEGQIDFETDLGRGTTFLVWLPRSS